MYVRLAASDQLTFFSDGAVEAPSHSGGLFGFERTAAVATGSADPVAKAAQAGLRLRAVVPVEGDHDGGGAGVHAVRFHDLEHGAGVVGPTLAGMVVSGGICSWVVLTVLMMTATLGFVTQMRTALMALGGLLVFLGVMSALQAHGIPFPQFFSPGPGITAVHLTVGVITFTIPIFTTIQAYRETLARLETKVGELHAAEGETRRLLDGQSRFFWEISHELRSPLTRLNLTLGKVRRESGPETGPALERMEN